MSEENGEKKTRERGRWYVGKVERTFEKKADLIDYLEDIPPEQQPHIIFGKEKELHREQVPVLDVR